MTIPGSACPGRSVTGYLRAVRSSPQRCPQGIQINRIIVLVEVIAVGGMVLSTRAGPARPPARSTPRIAAAPLAVEQTEMVVGHEAAARASNRDCRMATAAAWSTIARRARESMPRSARIRLAVTLVSRSSTKIIGIRPIRPASAAA